MHDLDQVEAEALSAAELATRPGRPMPKLIFAGFRSKASLPFRQVATRCFWDFSDPDQLMLVVRVACPSDLRLKVEQAVFRDTAIPSGH